MNRRQMMSTTGLGMAGFAVGSVLPEPACKAKDLSFQVATVIGALKDVAPLLPGQAQFIGKIVQIAEDFDAAYKRGDFENATTIFDSLVSNVNQLLADIGASVPPAVKVSLAIAGIAIRAIAVLLKNQGANEPSIVAKAGKARGAQASAVSTVTRLSNDADINAIFVASKP